MYSRYLVPVLLVPAATAALAQNAAPLPQSAPAAQAAPVQPAAPVISAEWKRRQAEELLTFVEGIAEEGLDPADYNVSRLRAAVAGKSDDLSAIATDTFLKVASDLMFGHVRGDGRVDWYVQDDSWNVYDQQALLARATGGEGVAAALRSLLPTHPQYAGLKAMLAGADKATADKIRINMDRWRWLPRDLGKKYVIVNVPAYTVALVENGQTPRRCRRDQDADAVAQRHHHRRDLQSVVGSAAEHLEGSRRQEGLCPRAAWRGQVPLAPAAGAVERARQDEAGDGQPARNLPARH
jgi:murein L,D-transpeptidase YcbB/YkuD